MQFPLRLLRPVALRVLPVLLVVGCASRVPYPPKHTIEYFDENRHFSICVPVGARKSESTAGRVIFTGFAVPAGTNLQEKQLIIAPGKYDFLHGAKAAGRITANITEPLTRAIVEEGSAGHSTLHVIYTWTNEKKSVHFDFTFRAVNVGSFDPANRPKEYDRAAQVKWSEEVMHTFVYWDAPRIAGSASR